MGVCKHILDCHSTNVVKLRARKDEKAEADAKMKTLRTDAITGMAAVLRDFGGPENLTLQKVSLPSRIGADEVLVRVRATSVNPLEWKMREGLGLPRFAWRRILGTPMILGIDFAGDVVLVGESVRDWLPGTAVMGATPLKGAYAEFLLLKPGYRNTAITRMPEGVSYEAAAALPFAGLVAYAGLICQGRLPTPATGRHVLIVGASGGVGHLAVQIAKRGLGAAIVVGVCSSRNAAAVRAWGADEVLLYDRETVADFLLRHPEWFGKFDLILDCVGDDKYWHTMAPSLLSEKGRFVAVGLPSSQGGIGEDVGIASGLRLGCRLVWRMLRGRYRLVAGAFGSLPVAEGLERLRAWMSSGAVAPHIAGTYELTEIGKAHQSSRTGRTAGKICVVIP